MRPPTLSAGETPELAARLVPVTDFAYVNLNNADVAQSVQDVFGAADHSTHALADKDGEIAWLTLVTVPEATTTAKAVAMYQETYDNLMPKKTLTIAGVSVQQIGYTDGAGVEYIWATHGVVGDLSADTSNPAEQFLRGPLGQWKAHGWA